MRLSSKTIRDNSLLTIWSFPRLIQAVVYFFVIIQFLFFQHSVREVRFPTRLAKSVCSKSNFPHVVLKSYVRYMFGKEILVSCAFPPSLRSGVNIRRDVNLLSRTCIVMYYFVLLIFLSVFLSSLEFHLAEERAKVSNFVLNYLYLCKELVNVLFSLDLQLTNKVAQVHVLHLEVVNSLFVDFRIP